MTSRKTGVLSWALYDWANSAFATTVMAAFFSIFFSSYWSSGRDSTVTTFWLGIANSAESLLVAVLAPFLGAIADKSGAKKKMLILFAFTGALLTITLAMIASGAWVQAMFVYIIASAGFAGANIFYDSMLTDVAQEQDVDFVSALGYSLGYIGGGLLFLINVLMYLFPAFFGLADDGGVSAVKVSFVLVGLWWIVFTIPLIIFVREKRSAKPVPFIQAGREGIRNVLFTLRSLRQLKQCALFLVAFWCYIDGVDTIIRMAVDYGTSLGFPAQSLIIALLITQFTAFPAALLYNIIGSKIGKKRAILIAIAAYGAISLVGFFMTSVTQFYVLAVMIGLFQGGIQALSRSYFTRFVPKGHEAQFFGFYNMLGKFAAIIGPLLVGIATLVTSSHRAGIFSLVILFLIGGILLSRVDEEEGAKAAEDYNAVAQGD